MDTLKKVEQEYLDYLKGLPLARAYLWDPQKPFMADSDVVKGGMYTRVSEEHWQNFFKAYDALPKIGGKSFAGAFRKLCREFSIKYNTAQQRLHKRRIQR